MVGVLGKLKKFKNLQRVNVQLCIHPRGAGEDFDELHESLLPEYFDGGQIRIMNLSKKATQRLLMSETLASLSRNPVGTPRNLGLRTYSTESRFLFLDAKFNKWLAGLESFELEPDDVNADISQYVILETFLRSFH